MVRMEDSLQGFLLVRDTRSIGGKHMRYYIDMQESGTALVSAFNLSKSWQHGYRLPVCLTGHCPNLESLSMHSPLILSVDILISFTCRAQLRFMHSSKYASIRSMLAQRMTSISVAGPASHTRVHRSPENIGVAS